MKKVLSMALVLLLTLSVFTAVPFSVSAAEELIEGYYTYTVVENKATIRKADVAVSGDVVIPDTLGGNPVACIGENAFEGCTGITSVTMPNTITRIEESAFDGCTTLKKVTLSDGLTFLGGSAFAYTAIESIELPKTLAESEHGYYFGKKYEFNGVEYAIHPGPFFACDSLKSITIAEGTTKISKYLFAGATGLEEITIPDSVTLIEEGAFENALRLKSIVIPDAVTKIDKNAFLSCVSLKDVKLSQNLTYLGGKAFSYTPIESIEIPRALDECDRAGYINDKYTLDSVEYSVPTGPFFACDSLKTVTFAKGTTQIPTYLFAGATGIEEINIPDTVTTIEENSFDSALRLKGVEIPDSVTKIDASAFENCVSLKDVKLSKYLTYMAGRAFGNTPIESIEIPKSLDKCDKAGYLSGKYEMDGKTYYVYYGPFYRCESLKTVTFEEGVTKIPQYLFAGAVGIETLNIPETVTTIEANAFYGAVRLNNLTIPDSVIRIDESAFENAVSLKNIVVPESASTLAKSAFEGCESLESAKLPSTITAVPDGFFANCVSLKTIEIPATVKTIGELSFMGCNALENVKFAENTQLEEIDNQAFMLCTSLTEMNIPEGVTTVGYSAFAECAALEKVTIPDTVKKLGDGAFKLCENLTDVTFENYGFIQIDKNAFIDCFSLSEITLPLGLKSINAETFKNNTSLTDVHIPESVTAIDKTAFSYPAKTTIYGIPGSYAETFAKENGFKFESDAVAMEKIELANGEKTLILEKGEEFLAKFNTTPSNSNYMITLSTDAKNVEIENHTIKVGGYSVPEEFVVTASTSNGVTYDITVRTRGVEEVVVKSEPKKLNYEVGEELDVEGLAVMVNYDDGTELEITDYEVTGFDSTKEGECEVTVKWKAKNGWTYSDKFIVTIGDVQQNRLAGDANGDGTVNVKDATLIQKFVANMVELGAEALAVSDVNEDGAVNVKDATAVQKIIANI